MTSGQAKEILLRYRPGTSDEGDAEVQAALDRASRDPDLAAWLEEHGTFQQEARERFRSIEVQAGLREQILSEKKARLNPWRTPRRLALTALAGLLIAVGAFVWLMPGTDPEAQFATYRSRMVKTALRGYAMDIETKDAAEISAYLVRQQGFGDWESPSALDTTPLMGCAMLTWRNQPTAMICFGKGPKPTLWLFVAASRAFPDPPAETAPRVEKVNRLSTVSWTSQGRTYLLAGEVPEAELLRLLDSKI